MLTGVVLPGAFFLFAHPLAQAQTCVFNHFIRASDNPFASCPPGTDTIVIRDSFLVNVNYEPIIGATPFQGLLLVDGGTIQWTANAFLKLGYSAKVVLINGGKFRPLSSNAPDCNSFRALYFDDKKVVDCNGSTAPHAFSDVNNAGCVSHTGICCNAYIVARDSSGIPDDQTICQPGDTVRLSVITSGELNYNILWSPTIGVGKGPHVVTPHQTSSYRVQMSAIFRPYDGTDAYLLSCDGISTITVNPPINATATATPVPCVDVPVGALNVTPTGGTAPYTYRWSNGATTKNLTNVPGGTYTLTITDRKGCSGIFQFAVPVQDDEPPTLSCPSNAEATANPGLCTTLIPDIDAVFSDNCPTVGVTYVLSGATTGSGEGQLSNRVPFSSGITTVAYRVDDGANVVTCTFLVRVNDTQPPVANPLPPLNGIACLAEVPAPEPSAVMASDNCAVTSRVHAGDVVLAGSGCPGDTLRMLRTYRAFDAAGNSATATQLIRVVDNQPPTFTFVPPDVVVNCQAIPAVGAPTAADNCSAAVSIVYNGQVRIDGPCFDKYTLRRRWTATDLCGNTATAEQTITVQDNNPPTYVFVPADVTVSCSAIPPVGTPVATDNCDNSVQITYVGQTRTDGTCPDSYILRRRWRAEDNCGNTATAEQVIVVQDFTPPTFTAVPGGVTVSCDAVPPVGTPIATDNCSSNVSVSYEGQTRVEGACPDTYTLLRRWTATDRCGNITTGEQVIAVRDITPPAFVNFPADATVSCHAVPPPSDPTASDNCSASVSVSYLGETRNNGNCPNNYVLLRRWQATDACGNTTISTQTLTVRDTEAPSFTFVPAHTTLSCEAIPPVGTPVAVDNCAIAVALNYDGQTRTDGPCPDTYVLTRRWTAADLCGNTRTATQELLVRDETPPVFTQVPADVTVSCDAIPPVGTANAGDNCDTNVSVVYDGQTRIDGACADNYTLVRRWVAVDNCGNTASAQQRITVRDLTPPTFTFVPPDATVNCDAIPNLGSPAAGDNCDNNVTITFAGVVQTNGSCVAGGTVKRRWIAEDNCGNTTVAEQVLTVQDTTRPVFVFIPPPITVSCENIPAPGQPQATDNCANDIEIQYNGEVRVGGACPDAYALRRRWTATDLCGNTATAEQLIEVRDIVPPAFTFVPPDVTVSCEAVPSVGQPTATDNCALQVNIVYLGETRTNGICPNEYVLLRRWTALDNCGNSASAQQRIIVRDQTPPAFTDFPADATVSCESIPQPATPAASDNCSVDVLVSYNGETRLDGPCPHTYTLRRRWTAVDQCLNTASAVQTITVQDLAPPLFTFVPADATVHCNSVPPVGSPTAIDNCSGSVGIAFDGETRLNGPCPDTYVLQRRWTATDNCGNTATALQTLSVQDVTPPMFAFVPPDITVSCEAVPAVGTPLASDDCDASVTISFEGETRVNGSCPDTYTLIRRWTAVDDCGNTASAQQVVVVRDLTPPVFTFVPADATVSCEDVPTVGTPLASDDCDASVTISFEGETRADGPCPDTYMLTRRWTAVDDCGNTAFAQQVVVVRDLTPPVFTFVPADATVSCEDVPAVGTPVASDNCDASAAISFDGETRLNGPCPDTYVLQRRWTATDNCGNTATALQTLSVQDITPPMFAFVPPDMTVNCDDIPAISDPLVSDNCDLSVDLSLTTDLQVGTDCSSGGVLIRRWTAVDNCGNSAVAEQRLTVQDTTKPVFTYIPSDTTVRCADVPAVDAPAAVDNCTADVSISFDGEVRTDGPCPDTYVLTRRWTAVDVCGNAQTAKQVIAVRDTEPPVFTFVPPNITVSCEIVPPVGLPVATDNCDADVSIAFDGELRTDGPCPDTYTLLRRWVATDNCGNTTAASQKIVVRDLVPPVFTFVPPNTTVNCENIPPPASPIATDNCDAQVNIALIGEERGNGPCPSTFTLTRRWVATDNCGNTAVAEQVLFVEDKTSPTFTFVPANITVECDAVPTVALPISTDNCTFSPTINYLGETRVNGNCPDTYTLVRRWQSTDECGNTKTAQQTIFVRDTKAPVFTSVPVDATVGCDAVPAPAQPSATDNCDTAVDILYEGETVVSASASGTYQLRRRWTAIDNCGNSATITQNLSVKDTEPPTISCPADVKVPADGATCSQVVVFSQPTFSDNCDANPQLSGNIASGAVLPVGSMVAVFKTIDDSGNSATCTFRITVADTTAPRLVNCPKDFTVTTPAGACEMKVFWDDPLVIDACDPYPILPKPNIASGSMLPTGQTTVIYTAQDSTGNLMSCSFAITVQENVPPILVDCPKDIVLHTNTCSAVATWTPPQVSDNCSPVVLNANFAPGTTFPETSTQVIYVATDKWGNTAACSFVVTVIDTVPPTFSGCPKDTVLSSNGLCSTVVNWQMPVATDNCAPAPVVTASSLPGDLYPVGHTKVQVVVQDPSGNKDVCAFKITVIGPPLGFEDVPQSQTFVGCSAIATWTPPKPTGVCAPAKVEATHQPGDTFPVGITTVVYTVSDTLGYSASASFTIAVTESIAPVFNCPVSPVVVDVSGAVKADGSQFLSSAQATASCDGVVLRFPLPHATDNCGQPLVEQTGGYPTDAFFPVGTHQLSFRATDAAGNTDLCSVTVVVAPLQPLSPQVSDKIGCAGDDIVLSTPVIPGATYLWTGPKPPYPNSNNLLIENLSPELTGIYTVQALVNGCYTPIDTALVRIGKLPKAVDDPDFEVETNGSLDGFSVLTNDTYEGDDFVVTVIEPLAGLTQTGNGLFTYQAGPNNGRVNFIYRLCSAACPDLCSNAVVTITVRESFCTYIPNVITPNDDGINDYLEIPCLNTDLYPNNRLVIYNQWGDKVFEASPYENDPVKAWRGTLNGRQGQPLPDGTYFYYFQPAPDRKPISGYLEIFR